MKYRIKITTFKNGRKMYRPQIKIGFLTWLNIDYQGEATIYDVGTCDWRANALSYIDLHYAGNTKKQIIEFEYINK